MQRFAQRRFLRKKVNLDFRDDADRPRLFCDKPAIVARFASEIRQKAIGRLDCETRVLMRGQTKNHQGMFPGIFRRPTHSVDRNLLITAEAQFEAAIRKRLKVGRFLRPNLAALLQHYGYWSELGSMSSIISGQRFGLLRTRLSGTLDRSEQCQLIAADQVGSTSSYAGLIRPDTVH